MVSAGHRPPSKDRRATRHAVPIVFFVVALLLSICPAVAPAIEEKGAPGKVVILVVDRVGISDLPSKETPFLERLAGQWSAGLLVTRTGVRAATEEIDTGGEYVSLGAGVRARGAVESALSFNTEEEFAGSEGTRTAGEFYRSFTGSSPPKGGVVCLGFEQVERNNEPSGNGENVGLLGSLLAEGGHRAAVAGNADDFNRPRRCAALICADGKGAVPLGNVGREMTRLVPGGMGVYMTDMERLFAESRRLLSAADLLVVDTGDTGRLDREAPYAEESFIEREGRLALRRVDAFADRLCGLLDLDKSLFLVVSPGAPVEARKQGNFLTPLIVAGRGFSHGMLSSDSTRRRGLVDNTDLLPTVLSFFGLDAPDSVIGSPMVVKGGGSIPYLEKMSAQLEVTRRARWPIVTGYLVLALVLVILTAFYYLADRKKIKWPRDPGKLGRVLAPLAAVLLAGPLSFLLVSVFSYSGYVFPALFCLLFCVVVGLASWRLLARQKRLDPVVFICLLTGAVQLVDLVSGGRLIMLPLLGVSSLEGMRFFGIPNTYAGILISVALFGAAGFIAGDEDTGQGARWAALSALLVVALMIGLGLFGANIGGFITAAATFVLFSLALSARRFDWKRVLAVPAVTAVGTAFVVLMDSLFFRTHVGKAAGGGISRFLPMLGRKVAIQLGQVRFLLVPSLILIIAVVAAAIWVRRPHSIWAGEWERNRPLMAALFSILVGAIVALLFNDTGFAMLGAMALIAVISICYYIASGEFLRASPESVGGPLRPAGNPGLERPG